MHPYGKQVWASPLTAVADDFLVRSHAAGSWHHAMRTHPQLVFAPHTFLQGFFQAKQSLEKGTTVTMLWRPEGVLELLLRESDDGVDYARVSQFGSAVRLPNL